MGDWYIEECTEEGYIGSLEALLSDEPTIDAVPVVRCKNCMHWDTGWEPVGIHYKEVHWCTLNDTYPDGDFFCAYADRRKGGGGA